MNSVNVKCKSLMSSNAVLKLIGRYKEKKIVAQKKESSTIEVQQNCTKIALHE